MSTSSSGSVPELLPTEPPSAPPICSSPTWHHRSIHSHCCPMTNDEQSRALRAAIKSLQSGLLTILEFLNILAAQSSDPEQFKKQIEAIKASLQLVDNLPPLNEDEPDSDDAE